MNFSWECPLCHDEFHGIPSRGTIQTIKNEHLREEHPNDIVEGRFGVHIKSPNYKGRGA